MKAMEKRAHFLQDQLSRTKKKLEAAQDKIESPKCTAAFYGDGRHMNSI